jgi:hypothetical protein
MDDFVRFSAEVGVTLMAVWAFISTFVIYRQRQKIHTLSDALAECERHLSGT